ncbi:MAG: PorV/PorQ family protein [Candidatus Krumholzibacteriia bacterium]
MKSVLLISALCLPLPALALGGAGVAAGDFLEVPVGARSMAMGGATGSVPGDVSALFRNPALLAGDGGQRLYFGHQEWYQGLQHETALLALGLPGRLGSAAVHARYLHLAPLPAYDSSLQLVGEVDVYDLAVGLSWARRFARRVDLGASVHNVQEYLAGAVGRGWAYDVGVGLVASGFYWSAAARNLGAGLDYEGEHLELEQEYSLGAARYLPALNTIVSLELRQPRYWGASVRGGVETLVADRLVLRAGYAYTAELDDAPGLPSFGLGVLLGGIGLDYSFQSQQHLGEVHSLGVRFVGPRAPASPYRYFRPSI